MPKPILELPETITLGPHTREWVIPASHCPAFATHQIRSVGVSNVGLGYRVVRHRPDFSHVNVCLEGSCRVWFNDHWTEFMAGTAGIFPRDVPHGAVFPGGLWRMCWVSYQEPVAATPLFDTPQISMSSIDPRPFEWLLSGLYCEVNGANNQQAVQQLVDLLHLHVTRLVKPVRNEHRLAKLWATVDADLARPWTAAELAEMAQVSEVHLRRLMLADYGHSPLQHLAWLRVRRAAYLLESQGHSVEQASWAVGYHSPSAFTRAFKRWQGRRPRQNRNGTATNQ